MNTAPNGKTRHGTALVTGASSGIGLELARELARHGHPLILVSRDRDRLEKVAKELTSSFDVEVRVEAKDLSAPGAAEELWVTLADSGVSVEILINNAGLGIYGDFDAQPLNTITAAQMVNVVALTTLTRLALPGMLARKSGRILNVASVVGYQPGGPRMAVYYATKAYVLSFSKGLSRELAGSGVSVTALCPGVTRSSFEVRAGASRSFLYRRTPQMSAEAVARAGFQGMMKRRRVVIPGFLPKLIAFAGELPPRALALEVNRFLLMPHLGGL